MAHLLVALAVTFPLLTSLGSKVPSASEPGLALRNVWAVNHVSHQLREHPLSLLDGNTFHNQPHSLVFGEPLIPEALLGLPGRLAPSRPALSYNLGFLASLASSGQQLL